MTDTRIGRLEEYDDALAALKGRVRELEADVQSYRITMERVDAEARADIERIKALEAERDRLLDVLKLHVAYEAVPRDRGGRDGPKGRAWAKFIAARDAALANDQKGEGPQVTVIHSAGGEAAATVAASRASSWGKEP